MSSRLSGKVCVITGTGGSMGRAAAVTFAREGASVVGCDLNVAAAEATIAMVREAGGTMVSLQPCQLTNPGDCQALVDLAVLTFGRIDELSRCWHESVVRKLREQVCPTCASSK